MFSLHQKWFSVLSVSLSLPIFTSGSDFSIVTQSDSTRSGQHEQKDVYSEESWYGERLHTRRTLRTYHLFQRSIIIAFQRWRQEQAFHHLGQS